MQRGNILYCTYLASLLLITIDASIVKEPRNKLKELDGASWPNWLGCDSRHTFGSPHAGPEEHLVLKWNFTTQLPPTEPVLPPIAIGTEGRSFWALGNMLVAVSGNGTELWQRTTSWISGGITDAAVSTDGNIALFRTEEELFGVTSDLVAVDTNTGYTRWTGFPCGDWLVCKTKGLTIDNSNTIYVAGEPWFSPLVEDMAYITAFTSKGKQLWSFDIYGCVSGNPLIDTERSRIFVYCYVSKYNIWDISVYNMPSGQKLWQKGISEDQFFISVNSEGDVILMYDQFILGLDGEDGSTLWKVDLGESVTIYDYCMDSLDTVYVRTMSQIISIFADGKINYQYSLPAHWSSSNLLVDSNRIVYILISGHDQTLLAILPNGTTKYSVRLGGPMDVIDTIMLGNDGLLYAASYLENSVLLAFSS